jgi:tetratricopeptide (TPR) repeat protein
MSRGVILAGAAVAMTFVVVATVKDARTSTVTTADAPAPRIMRGPDTSREQLTITVKEMSARAAAYPDDQETLLRLTEALLRLQRVNQDERSGEAAVRHLERFLDRHPDHYEVQRLRGAALASQHRFGEAIAQANALIARDPRDAVAHGIAGDAYLELGDYERGFAAFEAMGRLKPGPPAYGRIAYALELKGDLPGAIEYMQRAADGTTPNDAESQAWYFSQLGMLWLQLGKHASATREFERAIATFAMYPLAIEGLAGVRVAAGDLRAARKLLQEQFARTPVTHLAAAIGDLSAAVGDTNEAGRYHEMVVQLERAAWASGQRQPQVLSRFYSERGRDIPGALRLAQEAAKRQRDLATMDALAWAHFKAGQLEEAAEASAAALRTGSREARLLYHAAAISQARGDAAGARALLDLMPSRRIPDVLLAEGVTQLEALLR